MSQEAYSAQKESVDGGVANALEKRGITIVYTGDGKGKATATGAPLLEH